MPKQTKQPEPEPVVEEPTPVEEAKPVADEIQDNNSIHVWYDRATNKWTARLGPKGRGIEVTRDQPWEAIEDVNNQAEWDRWTFDPSWTPRD